MTDLTTEQLRQLLNRIQLDESVYRKLNEASGQPALRASGYLLPAPPMALPGSMPAETLASLAGVREEGGARRTEGTPRSSIPHPSSPQPLALEAPIVPHCSVCNRRVVDNGGRDVRSVKHVM
jgi:hypothetical protein